MYIHAHLARYHWKWQKGTKNVVLTDHVRSMFHSPRTTETDRRLHFPDRTKHVSDYVKE